MTDSFFDQQPVLSSLALAKLASSGISETDAIAAGLYSVANARGEVHPEFKQAPALVIPYFDVRGAPVLFERDGNMVPFVRVRYLAEPVAKGFTKAKPQRYAQLRGSGTQAYFPRVAGIDWEEVLRDTSIGLVIVEGELKALKGCLSGLATIGLGGVDNFRSRQGVAA